MSNQIEIQNKKINYTVKNSRRAKRLRLAIYCDGRVVATVPYGMNNFLVERFIAAKANWIINKLEFFAKYQGSAYADRRIIKTSKQDYLKYKDQVLQLVRGRINHFNQLYNFSFNKINIKNQKTRWGSCSKKGNLNFNYKLAFLPPSLVDYIVVHELCHLGEFNHQRKFWNLMSRALPNYWELKKELKNRLRG